MQEADLDARCMRGKGDMNLVYVRVHSKAVKTSKAPLPGGRTRSVSVSLIRALLDSHLISSAAEWRFVDRDPLEEPADRLPLCTFPADSERLRPAVARAICAAGQPDILWIEGTGCPSYRAELFELCPGSFKIVYSKCSQPWRVERLDGFDLCLIDDPSQELKVREHFPPVRCSVWDKLVDYQDLHRPIPCEKVYDVCYVAYLRASKNHELLFRALARLNRPALRCVCVGEDRNGNRATLEQLAADLNLQVHFTGEVGPEEVNRYINSSRVGVMCSGRDAKDAAPRALLEYMAADVPVLVNSELPAGARYVGPTAGLVCPPDQFDAGLARLLENSDRYFPREHYIAHYSVDRVVERFVDSLSRAGLALRPTGAEASI